MSKREPGRSQKKEGNSVELHFDGFVRGYIESVK
jgi:hypothetical protein